MIQKIIQGIEFHSLTKDLTNRRFGKLVAIKPTDKRIHRSVVWICRCDCGNEIKIAAKELTNGNKKNCGCVKNLVGKRFGRLVVVRELEKRGRNKQRLWECKCDCGKITKVTTEHLTNNHTKSCGCLKKENAARIGKKRLLPNNQANKNQLFCNYKRQARIQGCEFNLLKEDFLKLTSQNCFYCGREPSQTHKHSKSSDGYIYNGIDRLDNTRGYSKSNCVPCCDMCNKAKGNRTLKEFVNWANRLGTRINQFTAPNVPMVQR